MVVSALSSDRAKGCYTTLIRRGLPVIKNKTKFNTRDLLNFVICGLRAFGMKRRGPIAEIEFNTTRSKEFHGYWVPACRRIELRIPRNVELTSRHTKWLAMVLHHEIGHALGLEHPDMLEINQLRVATTVRQIRKRVD